MTSVVDTSVKCFTSSMVNAPVLNGIAGSFIGVLDALCAGFDDKVATSLEVSGGVATLSFSGTHSAMLGSVIIISGSSIAALNGEQKINHVDAGFYRFATAAANGVASGEISFKMAPIDFVKVFSGTNVAVYQSQNVVGTRMYFRIDDVASTYCRLRGYESMTDENTGVGMFPLDSQISGGGYMNKSNTGNTTAVKWKIIADSRGLYINIVGYSSTSNNAEAGRTIYIGDIISFRPGGDAYAFAIGCGTNGEYYDLNGTCDQASTATQYSPRQYHGLGSSTAYTSLPYTGKTSDISGIDSFFGTFPSKIDGGMRLSKRFIAEYSNLEPRGELPGLYTIPQWGVGNSILPGTIYPGTGALTERKLMALGCGSGSAPYQNPALGISMIDITGPWR